jgi:hypothetical protein
MALPRKTKYHVKRNPEKEKDSAIAKSTEDIKKLYALISGLNTGVVENVPYEIHQARMDVRNFKFHMETAISQFKSTLTILTT